jgi:hypothetical protein
MLLHDPAVRDQMRERIQSLTVSSRRQWGTMTVDQVVWHLSQAFGQSLAHFETKQVKPPAMLPVAVAKAITLNLPWPKGAPTAGEFVPRDHYELEAERARLLGLMDEFTAKELHDEGWGRSHMLGQLTGAEWSRLQAKHLDHHLRQFGA